VGPSISGWVEARSNSSRTRTERSISVRSATTIHIAEAPDVRAAFSGLVRTRLRQHPPVSALELADQIDGQVLAARREGCQRRVTLAAVGALRALDAGNADGEPALPCVVAAVLD
jgi:hypothetical protein